MVTSGEREVGRGKVEVDIQTTMYKISYKDILYSTGTIANIFIITINGI